LFIIDFVCLSMRIIIMRHSRCTHSARIDLFPKKNEKQITVQSLCAVSGHVFGKLSCVTLALTLESYNCVARIIAPPYESMSMCCNCQYAIELTPAGMRDFGHKKIRSMHSLKAIFYASPFCQQRSRQHVRSVCVLTVT